MDYDQAALERHKANQGKIEIKTKIPLTTIEDLAIAYTPGVAAVANAISADINQSWLMTNRANQVAIICDGTAVLGLGNIGAEAAMPIMEGKSAILKEFAGIDGIPLCINTTDPEDIIKFCKYIEPSFAGINLEDISAPRCFTILQRLEQELNIPIFHDDQDGTAIVALAAIINSLQLVNKKKENVTVVINGAGAAGIAITKLFLAYGFGNIILLDSQGIISQDRHDLNAFKKELLSKTNKNNISGDLATALIETDIFLGVSKGNLMTPAMVSVMHNDAIILAMANPIPEIMPVEAKAAGAAIVATGRSDFSNQVNNALVFPGMFKGLLTHKIKFITTNMKLAVAEALAGMIEPQTDKILPIITDRSVVDVIVNALAKFK